MQARIIVTLKQGVLDPQGKAIEGALKGLDIPGINSVRQGKVFELDVQGDRATAESAVMAACQKLLANLVVEDFSVEWV